MTAKHCLSDLVVSDAKAGHVEVVRCLLWCGLPDETLLAKTAKTRRFWARVGMSLSQRDEAVRALIDAREADFVVRGHTLCVVPRREPSDRGDV